MRNRTGSARHGGGLGPGSHAMGLCGLGAPCGGSGGDPYGEGQGRQHFAQAGLQRVGVGARGHGYAHGVVALGLHLGARAARGFCAHTLSTSACTVWQAARWRSSGL